MMMVLRQNKYMLEGSVVLKRDGRIVWYGPLTAPWEDVHCDTVVVSTSDFDKIKNYLLDSPIFDKWRNK